MRVLFKKLKRVSKVKKVFYFLICIIYAVTLGLFIYNLLKLKGIETFLRIIAIVIFIAWFFIYLLAGLVTMLTKRKKSFIFLTIISFIFSIIFAVGAFAINFIYSSLDFNKEYITYSSNLITLKDNKLTEEEYIGILNDENNLEGNILAKKLIEKEELKQELKHYETYIDMLADLYAGDLGGCIVPGNYESLFSTEENYNNISNEVEVVYEYSERMKNQDANITSEKKLTEPFTLLLIGIDSDVDGLEANQAFNGDTLMMITFNPNTLTATMFSIPRDLYVPIACRNGAKSKINSSAANGTGCVIDTIQDLTGITIDYYVKINFKGVVSLVDALGGISVDVPVSFCGGNSDRDSGNEICLKAGYQELDGEEALALARERHSYVQADIMRIQVQQKIVEAIARKATSIRSIEELNNILDAVSKNIDTNMQTDKILSFYEVGKEMLSKVGSEELIKIQKTYLEYYSLPVYMGNTLVSAIGYYEPSLEAITTAMKVNLELEESEPIKTFSISYNEEYETPLIGKGITGGTIQESLPSFIGQTTSYAQNWLSNRGISVSVQSASTYDFNYEDHIIIGQSVRAGTIVSDMSSIILYTNDPTNKE